MKFLYTLSFSILSLTLTAQTTEDNSSKKAVEESTYEKDFEQLKELHIAYENSEDRVKHLKLMDDFYDKIKELRKMRDAIGNDVNATLEWIKNNLDKTQFTSYEEAKKEWDNIQTVGMTSFMKNQEYFNFMQKCLLKYGPDILRKVMEEAIPNPYTDF
ncbi:hypothetical protein GN157_14975 [Flavobacterium rakeshii]|uniref:Uncharacterized protein n=1 Tax=Flavobacterium rakeshii TaxID=1038845 RepID=A0A6N8HH76_9FLAO|nr:hypothetical protein [Flavobacterium rakeshii]MUV05018.1 hypothetical protein [Flavobacterium rakeshii]